MYIIMYIHTYTVHVLYVCMWLHKIFLLLAKSSKDKRKRSTSDDDDDGMYVCICT